MLTVPEVGTRRGRLLYPAAVRLPWERTGESADGRADHQADTEAKRQGADRPTDQILPDRVGLERRIDPESPDYRGHSAAQAQYQAQPSQQAATNGESPATH